MLKGIALLAGALAAPPLFEAAAAQRTEATGSGPRVGTTAPTRSQHTLKIGVLVPGGQGRAGESLVTGMRLHFDQVKQQTGTEPVRLVPATYSEQQGVWRAANDLIAADGIDLVVGLMSPGLAAQLGPALTKQQTGLVVVNAGEDVPRRHDEHPSIFHHTLNYWESNYAIGRWAARHAGRHALVFTSFLDSGYDAPYAFRLGYEAAGGTIGSMQITHVPNQAGDLPGLLGRVRQEQPDFVYGMYGGEQALEFVEAYEAAGLAPRIPLLSSAFTVDDTLLAAHGPLAQGVQSCLSWSQNLALPESQAVAAAYRSRTGIALDAFAALGYDTALLLLEGLRQAGGQHPKADEILRAMQQSNVVGARGLVQGCSTSPATTAPLYLRVVQPAAQGHSHAVVATLEPVDLADQQVQALAQTVKTGWIHPYLTSL